MLSGARELPGDWIVPDWPAPERVKALITARQGGVSQGPYASFNLGTRVADDPHAVAENRRRLLAYLPAEPRWLTQVHGSRVVAAHSISHPAEADGAYSTVPNVVCTVMIADCLPVLLCDRDACIVGVAHAGWRGLAAGVIEQTIAAMDAAPNRLMAFLGPAIGPDAFEVGEDVYRAFVDRDRRAATAFRPRGPGKWRADLFELSRQRLASAGVADIYGGGLCTYTHPGRFFSHRRDRVTGRMAALIWLDA